MQRRQRHRAAVVQPNGLGVHGVAAACHDLAAKLGKQAALVPLRNGARRAVCHVADQPLVEITPFLLAQVPEGLQEHAREQAAARAQLQHGNRALRRRVRAVMEQQGRRIFGETAAVVDHVGHLVLGKGQQARLRPMQMAQLPLDAFGDGPKVLQQLRGDAHTGQHVLRRTDRSGRPGGRTGRGGKGQGNGHGHGQGHAQRGLALRIVGSQDAFSGRCTAVAPARAAGGRRPAGLRARVPTWTSSGRPARNRP